MSQTMSKCFNRTNIISIYNLKMTLHLLKLFLALDKFIYKLLIAHWGGD